MFAWIHRHDGFRLRELQSTPLLGATAKTAQPEERDAVLEAIEHGRRKLIAALAVGLILLGLYLSTTAGAAVEPPVESRLTPLLSVDLRSFSDRAAAWTEAHREHRDRERERALSLAAQARVSQESQAAVNTTTTAAPTTTPAPTTTAASTTAGATDASGSDSESSTTTSTAITTTTSTATTTTTAITTTTTAVPSSTTAAATTRPAGERPTEEQWEALRQCESTGNYRAISISPPGRYRGAYQFSRSTWDWVASRTGADHLVGVDPAEASPADQDRMALALWEINGWAPWPACSRKLGYL